MNKTRLGVAVQAAKVGGGIAMKYFRKPGLFYREKQVASDVVSIVDQESGEKIIQVISKYFPKDNILTEEEGYTDNNSNYTWIVDDIDGTNPYRTGLPNFGISVGCLFRGEPLMGAINLPYYQELYLAKKGKGAYLNGSKIKVNKANRLNKARLCVDYGHFGQRETDLKTTGLKLIEKSLYLDSYGCAVQGLSYVASGRLSAYLHHRAFPWDFCAGSIIVQEAGGTVTDHKGDRLDWTKKKDMYILASNGFIHKQILKLIN